MTAGAPLGGPAEEARRLAEAIGEWASTRLGTAGEQVATGSPECQLCPVCQLIVALRGQRPEVVARFGDAWASFLGALGALGAHGGTGGTGKAADGAGKAAEASAAAGPEATATEAGPGDARENPLRPVQQIRVD